MRKTIILLLCFAPFVVSDAEAQLNATEIPCDDCRDPLQYPEDWANHAFNQVYGDDAYLTFDEADDFWLYNPRGDRVYVDVDFIMTGLNFLGQKLPLWPTNTIQITLALPDGTLMSFQRSVFHDHLPVPSPTGSGDDNATTTSGGDNGNDGVDDEPYAEDEEMPEIEREGTVTIVDPDENGDFPEPEWCQEC